MKRLHIRTRITIIAGVLAALALGVLLLFAFTFASEDSSAVPQTDLDVVEETDTDPVLTFEFGVVVFIALLVLAGIGLLIWTALGRTLSPVRAMADQVDLIDDRNLHQRVDVPSADDELKSLALTMNRMLDRLQLSRDRQRRFVSDASHELRSPITATQATLEVARARPERADWVAVSDVLVEENQRLAALVDDLLLLARLDEGEQPTAAENWPVDLDELCLAEAARPRSANVRVRIDTPVRVPGSQAMLTRAVRNLIDNASDHAENVEVVVGLEYEPAIAPPAGYADDGPMATITVNDDGPGIDPEYRQIVFDRFTRLDEARARVNGGAGLGLAIVASVAAAHGGQIAIGQSPMGGASFTLSLATTEGSEPQD